MPRKQLLLAFLVACLATTPNSTISQGVAAADIGRANAQVLQIFDNGDFIRALMLASETVLRAERELGPDHPEAVISFERLALTLNQVAIIRRSEGKFGEAEHYFISAIDICLRVFGPEHRNTHATANNLAGLYDDMGHHEAAEKIYRHVIQSLEKRFGPYDRDVQETVNNLGVNYLHQKKYAEAERLLEVARAFHEEVVGPESEAFISTITNLAVAYRGQGSHDRAEQVLLQARSASQKVLGPHHPLALKIINNLAFLYTESKPERFGEAEPLYRQALRGRERVLGAEHPDTLETQYNLASLLAQTDRTDEALSEYRVIDLRAGQWLETEVHTMRSAALQRAVLTLNSVKMGTAFSLVLAHPSEAGSTFAAELVLRWKKRLLQSDAAASPVLARTNDPALLKALDEIRVRYAELSQSAFDSSLSDDARLTMREDLEEAQAQLRLKLQALGLEDANNRAGLNEVRAALPNGTALVEYRFFEPYDFAKGSHGATRLLAVVITGKGLPQVMDLGELPPELLDARLLAQGSALRGAVTTPGSDLPPIVRLGYNRLIAPVLAQLDGVQTLILSPDGPLHALPFEAFLDASGSRLIERYQVRMVQTGRDLVGREGRSSGVGLVAVGGVDFGPWPGFAAPESEGQHTMAQLKSGEGRALDITRHEISDFDYLKWSLTEAEGVERAYAARYPNEPRIVLTKALASERALKDLGSPPRRPPRVLHLATHGFYLANDAVEGSPLLQSGVALAGANRGLAGEALDGENGVLHAEEVQALNLVGTELVVLSACDTGQGAPDYSEGLEGLPRAFRLAGARNVLVALWPIGDEAARLFMERFYTNWLAQEVSDPGRALQETKLDFIRSTDSAERDPSRWAPFVLFEG